MQGCRSPAREPDVEFTKGAGSPGTRNGACQLSVGSLAAEEMHLQEELLRIVYGENLYVTAAGALSVGAFTLVFAQVCCCVQAGSITPGGERTCSY